MTHNMNHKYDIRNYGTTVLRQAQKPLRWLGDGSEMASSRHTPSILMSMARSSLGAAWEQPRSSLEPAWSKAKVCLEYASGMKYAFRLAAVLLVMIVG